MLCCVFSLPDTALSFMMPKPASPAALSSKKTSCWPGASKRIRVSADPWSLPSVSKRILTVLMDSSMAKTVRGKSAFSPKARVLGKLAYNIKGSLTRMLFSMLP